MLEFWHDRSPSGQLPCVKLLGTTVEGRTVGVMQLSPNTDSEQLDTGLMVGEANESEVLLENIECQALLDTGSTVSTVSEQFYKDHCSHLALHPIKDFLRIECADGQLLPYLGYVVADVGLPSAGLKTHKSVILLVVPNTEYNRRVPLLLGTNVLRSLVESCQKEVGTKFMQTMAQHTPWWLAFRHLNL